MGYSYRIYVSSCVWRLVTYLPVYVLGYQVQVLGTVFTWNKRLCVLEIKYFSCKKILIQHVPIGLSLKPIFFEYGFWAVISSLFLFVFSRAFWSAVTKKNLNRIYQKHKFLVVRKFMFVDLWTYLSFTRFGLSVSRQFNGCID